MFYDFSTGQEPRAGLTLGRDFFTIKPRSLKNAMEYHTKIYKAIERHDPTEAKKQMEFHIKSLIRRVNQFERNSLIQKGGKKNKAHGDCCR
jgi:DNA-binding GntR family transcriptional regulator